MLAALLLLHIVAYGIVVVSNAHPPFGVYWDFGTAIDDWVPYLPWTSVIYYFGDLFILGAAGAVLWRLGASFVSAVRSYAALIISGAGIQIMLPTFAPWPDRFTGLQATIHGALHLSPFAVFPSMHVALSVLPAGIALSTTRSVAWKIFLVTAATLIAISTVTAREHCALDVFAGALLGTGWWAYWRFGLVGSTSLARLS